MVLGIGIAISAAVAAAVLLGAAYYTGILGVIGGTRIGAWLRAVLVKVAPRLVRKLPKWGLWQPYVGFKGLLRNGLYRFIGLTAFIVLPLKAAFDRGGVVGVLFWVYETVGGLIPRLLNVIGRGDTIARGVDVGVQAGFPFITVSWPYGSQVLYPFVLSVGAVAWAYMAIRFVWKGMFGSDEAEVEVLGVFLIFVVPVTLLYVHHNDVTVAFQSVGGVVDGVQRFLSGLPWLGGKVEAAAVDGVVNGSVNAWAVNATG